MDASKLELLSELNNEGAFFIEQGDANNAISVFNQALKVAMETSNSDSDENMVNNLLREELAQDERLPKNHAARSRSDLHRRSIRLRNRSNRSRTSSITTNDTIATSTESSTATMPSSTTAATSPSSSFSKPTATSDGDAVISSTRASAAIGRRNSKVARSRQQQLRQQQLQQQQQQQQQKGQDEEEDTHFVFDKPLKILDRFVRSSYQQLSFYIVFNLALSYHIKTLQRYKPNGRRKIPSVRILKRILKLYKIANSMLERENDPISVGVSHCIGILNNIAQVYRTLGYNKKADKYSEQLLVCIVYLFDRGLGGEVQQLDKFILTVSHLIGTTCTACAA